MISNMNLSDYAIVSDFDGTITLKDTNDALFYEFGEEENKALEKLFLAGKLDYRAVAERHFEIKPLTFEEYYSFLDSHAQIDNGFNAFMQIIRKNNLDFYIVSGGFLQAINHLLKDYDIPKENIFANSLIFQERLKAIHAHNISSCPEVMGPCGNCKKICLESIKKQTGKKIMFIGDGFSDRCAVKLADYVFAKDSLMNYCEKHNISYQKFTDFDDISDMLRNAPL